LVPIQYNGKPSQRKNILEKINEYDILICSYDILRNDIDEISNINFNYAVLDEGHIIRNPKVNFNIIL
jgi:TATA-binding protein-associated factor